MVLLFHIEVGRILRHIQSELYNSEARHQNSIHKGLTNPWDWSKNRRSSIQVLAFRRIPQKMVAMMFFQHRTNVQGRQTVWVTSSVVCAKCRGLWIGSGRTRFWNGFKIGPERFWTGPTEEGAYPVCFPRNVVSWAVLRETTYVQDS